MSSLLDWTLLGRFVGRASGWDMVDTFSIILYDFEPDLKYPLPSGHVTVDFEDGTMTTHDDKGKVILTVDLIGALRD